MNVEVYGFVFWLASFAWMGLWFLWAFFPDEIIREKLNVSYYPSKWWALALPTYGLTCVFVAFFGYFALTLAKTRRLDSRFLIADESTPNTPYAEGDKHDIPRAHDIPLRFVNKLMYDT
jgi:phosphatidylinositol glycan class P protein